MRLYERFYEPCVILVETAAPDGEGGFSSKWGEAGEIPMAIVGKTLPARIAEEESLDGEYTVTYPMGYEIGFHTVVRRESGETLRIESQPQRAPISATFSFMQADAKRWEVPHEE